MIGIRDRYHAEKDVANERVGAPGLEAVGEVLEQADVDAAHHLDVAEDGAHLVGREDGLELALGDGHHALLDQEIELVHVGGLGRVDLLHDLVARRERLRAGVHQVGGGRRGGGLRGRGASATGRRVHVGRTANNDDDEGAQSERRSSHSRAAIDQARGGEKRREGQKGGKVVKGALERRGFGYTSSRGSSLARYLSRSLACSPIIESLPRSCVRDIFGPFTAHSIAPSRSRILVSRASLLLLSLLRQLPTALGCGRLEQRPTKTARSLAHFFH